MEHSFLTLGSSCRLLTPGTSQNTVTGDEFSQGALPKKEMGWRSRHSSGIIGRKWSALDFQHWRLLLNGTAFQTDCSG
jgi:hypothetical protein